MKADLRSTLLVFTSLFGLLSSNAAFAEGGDASATDIPPEEITVSARRTDEKLQDVPLSISVFTSEALAKRGVDSAMDLAAITPNFHFYSANGRSDTSALFIRGLNANTTDARYQNVTFFMDGIPLSGTVMGLPTNNVKQVEIVKGPQSATFGKATYSGAVNYITQDPTPDGLHVSYRGRVMDGKDSSASMLAAGRIEFPVIKDALWMELTGSFQRDGALYRDPATGQSIGLMETTNVGVVIYSQPAPGLSIKLRGQYEYDRDSAPALVLQGPREWAAAGVLTRLPSGLLWSSKLTDPRPYAGCSAAGLAEIGACGAERSRWFGALVAKYDFAEGWQASLLAGAGRQRGKSLGDLYYATAADPLYADRPAPTKAASNYSDSGFLTEDWSTQLVIASPADRKLRGRVGFGYFYDAITYYQTIGSGALAGASNPEGKRQGKLWGSNAAIFAGLDWNFVAPLTLSLEGRLERQTIGYDPCTICRYALTDELRNRSTNFLPRATLKYDLSASSNVYVLYSKGTRPARYNDTQPPSYPIATAEKLNNYEVGSKNYFFGGRAMLNLAAFYQKLSNQQYRTIVPGTSVQSIQNVASSRVWGFEAETLLKITPSLTFTGGIGYANHKFTSSVSLNGTGTANTDLFAPGQANVLGLTSYNTPRWNGSASLEYKRPAFGDFDFAGALNYSYTGKQYADLANVQTIDAANVFDARIALESQALTIAFLVRNLTDNNTPTGSNLGATRACLYIVPEYPAASQRCNVAGMRRPREFGLEFGVRF